MADPLRGPKHKATLLIPPGVDDLEVARPRVSKAYRGRTARPARRGDFPAPALDWRNSGGNAERNGLSSQTGPAQGVLLWSGGPASTTGWQAFTEGGSMFVVRQNGFPPEDELDSVIYALDVETGVEIWRQRLPFERGLWTAWIAGVNNSVVYASRSGLRRPDVGATLFALDAATGDILWESKDKIHSSVYDGVVFAPDGDLILGSSPASCASTPRTARRCGRRRGCVR